MLCVSRHLQGADIIVRNDHKPLACFLNGKNTNNKVNRWSLELATYISFEWISEARNKAADCLSRLVTPRSTSIKMLTASSGDGPSFPYQKLYPEYLRLHFSSSHRCCTPTFPKILLLYQNQSQLIVWMPYFKCKGPTLFASAFLEDY